jgi:hypothetical protein
MRRVVAPRVGRAGAWLVALAVLAGCGGPRSASGTPADGPGTPQQSAEASPAATATGAPTAELPGDFPVPGGLARVAAQPDEPGLAARWTTERSGAEIYAELLDSLPAAGYKISDLFPGGAAAVIRFEIPGHGSWEVALYGANPLTVELRVPTD